MIETKDSVPCTILQEIDFIGNKKTYVFVA